VTYARRGPCYSARVRWIALATVLLTCAAASAQDVEEEVVGGGMLFNPEDLEPPDEEGEGEGDAEGEAAAEDGAPPAQDVPPPAQEAREAEVPELEPRLPLADEPIRYTLPNGLRVVLQPVEGRRFAAVGISYDVGSGDVPQGWTGLAHLTEHLMFSGTDRLDETAVYRMLEASGAVVRNAVTTVDRTTFYAVLPVAQMETALWIESHRMARMLAGLSDARLDRQREVVLHEGWERNVYGWRGTLHQLRYSGVFGPEHPYAEFVEREDDVRAIRLRHVQWFFQRHYGPDDATLIVVGGFDVDRVRESIERHFSPVVRSAPAPDPVEAPPVQPLAAPRRIEVSMQYDRDMVEVVWPTPALFDDGDAALDLFSGLMTDRREAPLFAELVQSGIAIEMNARQYSHADASVYVISAVPARDHTVEECLAAIDRALDRVRAEPFGAEDVDRARHDWARRMRLEVEDLGARLGLLAAQREGYVPTLENERQRYLAVDADHLRETIERWLPRDRRLVLIGRGDPAAPPQAEILVDEGRPEP